MKIDILLLLLLSTAGLTAQSVPPAERLKNGLEFYHLPLAGREFVSLALVFDAGPSHQSPTQNGISRLGANFINTGSIAALSVLVEPHFWSAGFGLFVTLPADSAEIVIQALAQVFAPDQTHEADYLARQSSTSHWIERTYNGDDARAQRGLLQALWGNQWQRQDPVGDFRIVSSLSLEDIAAWKSRYIVPRNCALIVIGNIDEGHLLDYVEASLEELPPGANPFTQGDRIIFPYLIDDVDTLVVANPVAPLFSLAWQGPGFRQDPAGTYAARVFVELLNNESGTFQQAIRGTNEFIKVTAEFEPSKYLSTIVLRCFPKPGSQAATTALVEQLLDDYTSAGKYSRLQIVDARKAVQIAHARLTQSPTLLVRALAEAWARGELATFNQFGAAIGGITRTEIERYVSNYIVGQPRVGIYSMQATTFRLARPSASTGAN